MEYDQKYLKGQSYAFSIIPRAIKDVTRQLLATAMLLLIISGKKSISRKDNYIPKPSQATSTWVIHITVQQSKHVMRTNDWKVPKTIKNKLN